MPSTPETQNPINLGAKTRFFLDPYTSVIFFRRPTKNKSNQYPAS